MIADTETGSVVSPREDLLASVDNRRTAVPVSEGNSSSVASRRAAPSIIAIPISSRRNYP
jgi:hypothetical protein